MIRTLTTIIVSIILCSCGKKYLVQFYPEGVPYYSPGGSIVKKTFRAMNDVAAYKKAVKMIMKLEEKNESTWFIYKDFDVFVAKTKKMVRISPEVRYELRGIEGMEYYLKTRSSTKQKEFTNGIMNKPDTFKEYQKIQSDIKRLKSNQPNNQQ